MDKGGANKLLLPRGLIIGDILDASGTFAKSCGLRGALRWLQGPRRPLGGQWWTYGAPMNSSGPEVLIIGATLDASQTFSKSGGFKGAP